MSPAGERQILMAPDVVARAAAAMAPDAQAAWMLRRPRALRQSFAEEVLDAPDRELAQQIWMLRQPRDVRLSFVEEVGPRSGMSREELWMLRQTNAVCRSYVDEVLLAGSE